MKIFSGSSNQPLAEKVANDLGVPLSQVEIHMFPDGERRVRVLEKVVGEDCVVVQSTSIPVDHNYMELYFIVDALKRSGARSITTVIPYLGYQRQDHIFREGEAVSLSVVIKTLENIGAIKVIAVDLHSIKIPEFFSVPIIHVSALELFAQKIRSMFEPLEDIVLVSPDMGGIRRIKILSELLDNTPYIAVEKNRDLATGEVEAHVMYGEVKKIAVIVDDMISSGNTIAVASDLLVKKGVEQIVVFATHPVFSEHAPEVLQNSKARKIYVTDTIFVPKEKRFKKLEILSVSNIIAESLSVS